MVVRTRSLCEINLLSGISETFSLKDCSSMVLSTSGSGYMNDVLLSPGPVEVAFLGESSLPLSLNWFPSKAEKDSCWITFFVFKFNGAFL